ncbi:hypothetical protein [Streptomyces qinglanensis]|uniref:hypothetical protein n=1 Tax=Streptomyces qinglanensis TaxID=943816 RepID=UPI003D748EB5
MTSKNRTTRADLPLTDGGKLAARVTVLDRGCVRYVVRGPHIRGTFVLSPEHLRGGTVLPSTLRVQFGDGTDDCGYWEHRDDEPVIFGMRLHGWTDGIDPDQVSDRWFLGRYARSLRPNGVHRELTSTVRRRTEDVIRALAAHWRRLPYRHELVLAAARPQAEELAQHEAQLATRAEAEAAELRDERLRARRRVNVLTGIRRRSPLPVRPAAPALVRLPLVDRRGDRLGVISVREVAVDSGIPGTVVYEVHGARVHGRFTVGRNIYRPQPLPEGIHVAYGHARKRYERERDHEPTVNGVRLDGRWDHDTTADVTASVPAHLPAHVRLTRTTGHSAPDATASRASAVLRALALHYLARPDVEALRLAAAKAEAPRLLTETRTRLRDLRRRQAAVARRAQQHRAREQQYRALVPTSAPVAAFARAA